MKILFLSHYFYPEGNAPATRIHQLTRRWATAGHEVTVVTAVPNVPAGVVYEGYKNRWYQEEEIDGVRVRRVWTYLAANKGRYRRIASFISFMITATIGGLRGGRPDVIVATSPQFFCGWAGRCVAMLRRRPFVLEIRDLWPESIVAVGAMRRSFIIRVLEWMEKRLYRAASLIVTVGDGYRRSLLNRSIPEEKVEVVPNGVDLTIFASAVDRESVRAEFGLGARFVCAFVGTIGMASGLDVVLRAARVLRARSDDEICFLLVGDGAERERLQEEASREDLQSIVFTGRLARERIPDVVGTADACLVHLIRTPLFRSVMPSKIFEAAAMQRPVILGVGGEAADWIQTAQAGIAIEPENEDSLLDAIDLLKIDPALRDRFGAQGRAFVQQHHDYELLAAQYLDILDRFSDGH